MGLNTATARGAVPASSATPAIHDAAANTNIEIARSAPKTLPRKRSLVFKCSRVVENTHTVEVPECASAITAKANQTPLAVPSKRYPIPPKMNPNNTAMRKLRSR